MVYSDTMVRTQIYLDDTELELLDKAGAATGASRSELVRRAIRRVFGTPTRDERLRALEQSAGSWGDLGVSGADYVDRLRGDLGQRLQRLGLE